MLVILDRDGVINIDPGYIAHPDDWHAYPGSLEAIACLKKAGHVVVVASNQSGIGRGLIQEEALFRVHEKMQAELISVDQNAKLDGIYYCPHHPQDDCRCRKPKTGLLEKIFADFPMFSSKESWFVGDSLSDLQAGARMGCQIALVRTGYGKQTEASLCDMTPAIIADNLDALVKQLLGA